MFGGICCYGKKIKYNVSKVDDEKLYVPDDVLEEASA
jgi:hypothetical protein